MFYPILDSEVAPFTLIGFARNVESAGRTLGRPAKQVEMIVDTDATTFAEAWDHAETLQQNWTSRAEDYRLRSLTGVKIATPVPAQGRDGRFHLQTHVFRPTRLWPIARDLDEAMKDPLGFAEAHVNGRYMHQGHEAQAASALLPSTYKHRANAERHNADAIAKGYLRIIQTDSGAFRAEAHYWKLPPIQMPRDRQRIERGQQYDLWGNWHADVFTVGDGPNALSIEEEGSGRVMGSE